MILTVDELLKIATDPPEIKYWQGEEVVICDGVFDLLHPGHVDHLLEAAREGSFLIVMVAKDSYVNKGPDQPYFSQQERAFMIDCIKDVDIVTLVDLEDTEKIIKAVKPDVYCKGEDYRDSQNPVLIRIAELVAKEGGRIAFVGKKTHSSTAIGERLKLNLKGPIVDYIKHLKGLFSFEDICHAISAIGDISVRVIGEQIIDQYIYVNSAGKAVKDNIITFTGDICQTFSGGTTIIAGHLMQLVNRVLLANKNGAITKIRYVDQSFAQKVFSCVPYPRVMMPLDPDQLLGDFYKTDISVIADFGHGLIPNNYTAREICRHSKWIALTVQSNSLNWGFNLLTKYPSAQYVVVDEAELRLACGEQNTPVEQLLRYQFVRMGMHMVAVTLGHQGCLLYNGIDYERVPALARVAKDRIGAGDAFLAYSAPLVYLNCSMPMAGFVGSVAAALEVEALGNVVIEKSQVINRIKELWQIG